MESSSSSSSGSEENLQSHTEHHYLPAQHHNTLLSFNSIIIIIISVVSIFVLLAIFLIIIKLYRLKSAKNRSNGSCKDNGSTINNTDTNSSDAHAAIHFPSSNPDAKGAVSCLRGGNMPPSPSKNKGVQVFTYKEMELATDNFSEANVIGNGGFGSVVYRGILPDGTIAAIKKLRKEGKQGERAFRMEVDLLSRLDSPYLVELLGYCADLNHRLLIFEYMPNGSLQQHLHGGTDRYPPLDWGSRLRIALDCSRALEFLHDHTVPTIIHRDFKCTNVLLDHNLRAKVADFRLAKMGSDKINGQISTRVLGTTGYLAPEYASTGKLTTKSDVYSYGVVLLELLTGRVPVDTKRPPGEHVLVSWALPRLTNREKVVEMVDPALQGQFSKKDLIQVAAIAAMCVQAEADYRPLMADVVQSLVPLVKSFHSNITSSASSRFHSQSSSSPRY